MTTHEKAPFLAGVIEGFYGQPWTSAERLQLFDWMAGWGLNTYLYAPKDDLRQRATWREPYPDGEGEQLRHLPGACNQRRLHFIYALSPGLDIRYSEPAELDLLKRRFEQVMDWGVRHFALLFDDIPDRLDTRDIQQFGSLASAQCYVANAIFNWQRQRIPDARLLFCPTPYCGRMAAQQLGGANYLPTLGRELLPEIDVFWTGPDIISREITVAHVSELQAVLRRKPLIWDNLYANDYDGRRFFCGPYAGRPPGLLAEVSGSLCNPNNEFPLNYVPLRTFAEFVQNRKTWEPREAYLAAMREWLPRFAVVGQPASLDDLILLGDCYYLPHEEGPEAEALYAATSKILGASLQDYGGQADAFRKRVARLREFCSQLANLRDRSLFYALSRRVWELREELDLLDRYIDSKSVQGRAGAAFTSDFHLPGTYRGGMVPRLQRLLVQHPDGTFTPASTSERVQTLHQSSLATPSIT